MGTTSGVRRSKEGVIGIRQSSVYGGVVGYGIDSIGQEDGGAREKGGEKDGCKEKG